MRPSSSRWPGRRPGSARRRSGRCHAPRPPAGCARSASARWELRLLGEVPEGGLALLDPDAAVELEHAQVRHRLADGGPAHEPGDVVPRARPLHMRRDVPSGVWAVAQDVYDLVETLPVVLAQLLEPAVQ